MIEFKDVAFQYEQGSSKGKIENINLTIHDGEVVLICGESGCGKTTLTRLINGLIPHYYEGTLTGQTIVEERQRRMERIKRRKAQGLQDRYGLL